MNTSSPPPPTDRRLPECEHRDVTWRSATPKREALNEAAWCCLDCLADLGFRPDLDRENTFRKVRDILMDFHESHLIYISNGTTGDVIAENVAVRCFEENTYDQEHILRFILDDPNMHPDSQFWQNRATRWLMGGEPVRQEQEALPFS